MGEKKGAFTSHTEVLHSPMSRHHNTDVWTFLILMIMIEHMKMIQMHKCILINILSMLLSGQVRHTTNSSQLFWNTLLQKKKFNEDSVLVQVLSYKNKNNLPPITGCLFP